MGRLTCSNTPLPRGSEWPRVSMVTLQRHPGMKTSFRVSADERKREGIGQGWEAWRGIGGRGCMERLSKASGGMRNREGGIGEGWGIDKLLMYMISLMDVACGVREMVEGDEGGGETITVLSG